VEEICATRVAEERREGALWGKEIDNERGINAPCLKKILNAWRKEKEGFVHEGG
jgi:hypothetical protein